ncbi:LysR substrate-binding domain-containing protein [Microvirga sp. CF3016]|jgi:LysR family hca operon transcriptional activator|uniref:LysR substrate-binding domain-containing protein n=1 Tax=Microvirga sp. CF3016 TaxID=3110181 RepID=UPI002DE7F19A|nr:LysR substrate-binding domain-containing protein [Microvirga sp. CF3016]MEE1610340.1 LysR substrate-binding domain-containing protein [Microvirga sp. CF3016]HEV2566808.1 LysR substrate-binding domain-containing protein [Microvirga sp.]
MELRHLRYFVAVAEEGSLTVAAEKRLHTAQPSLSRQLRDLELEVGTQLFVRTSRGVVLTAAGQAFLDHARLALGQAAEAVAAARRAVRPAKASFSVGFLTGQEVEWLSHVTHVLRDQLKDIDFRVTSDFSPAIAAAVQRGEIDLGFSRIEPQPDVTYKVIAEEPIVAILPCEHPLAERSEIDPADLDQVSFIGYSDTPHVLRSIVERYLRERGVALSPSHFLDGFATGISLVASTGGLTLLPAYVEPLLPRSVVSRPLAGSPPMIEIAAGYRADNPSPVLASFLQNIDQLIASRSAVIRRSFPP